jgi:broad specificity phosphatase PhoE
MRRVLIASAIAPLSVVARKVSQCSASSAESHDDGGKRYHHHADGKPLEKIKAIRISSSKISDQIPPGTKIVHWVRHGQGIHNVAGEQDRLHGYLKEENEDALLTEKGKLQCNELAIKSKELGICDRADLLVVSPMHRTIQTASYGFPLLLGKIPWIAIENLRETTGLHPCDRRRPISEHMEHYPHIDFSHVLDDIDPLYHLYTCEREPDAHVALRARKFLEWLAAREEKEVVVVTHSAFLRVLFRTVFAVEEADRTAFNNCELRTFLVTMPEAHSDKGANSPIVTHAEKVKAVSVNTKRQQ